MYRFDVMCINVTVNILYNRHCGQEVVVPVGVVVQEMVPSDVSGVLFTNHPVTGSCNHMTIDASYGLGEVHSECLTSDLVGCMSD